VLGGLRAMTTQGPGRVKDTLSSEQLRAIGSYLRLIAGPDAVCGGSYVNVRYRVNGEMSQGFLRSRGVERAARSLAELSLWTDVYVACAPRMRRGGGRDAVSYSWTLWIDA